MSTSPLNTLLCLHAWPLNPVVYRESYLLSRERSHLGTGFPLRCFQRLSVPHIATQHVPLVRQLGDQRCVHSGPLVLGATSLKSLTPVADRDRTVSRRSEPSSRTTLIGEQPNPWDLLQPQDVMSRHRGAKLHRRYGLLDGISLLSPEYLLSVERWPFHAGPPDHFGLLSHLLELSLSQSSSLMPLRSTHDFQPC